MNTKAKISKKRRKQRTHEEELWAYYEELLWGLFSEALELPKDVLRAAISILEEATWGLPSSDPTLLGAGRSPEELLTTFEKRWGPMRQGMPIPMPHPVDILRNQSPPIMAQRPKPLPMAIPGRIKGVPPSQTTLGHATSWDARSFAPPRMDPSPKPVIAPPKAPPLAGATLLRPPR
jgi:hypothetical protein